jgi:hypothetical protein
MKRLLLATAAVLALAVPASADVIVNLGTNPSSGTGAFSNTNPGTGAGGSGLFTDIYTFDLIGAPQFITIAGANNTFADPSQFITNFNGSVVFEGADGNIGGGDDVTVIGPAFAGACAVPFCQQFSGSALLGPGAYHLEINGTAGVNAGYGGTISTFGVPGPIVGAGLPGLLALFGFGGFQFWRRRTAVS